MLGSDCYGPSRAQRIWDRLGTRRDLDGDDLRGDELVRAAIRVLDVHLPLQQESDVRELAAVRAGDRLHVV